MVRRICWLGILLVISNLVSLSWGRAIETAMAAPPVPGTVWAWGWDGYGALGDGTEGSPFTDATPGQVVGPTSGTFLSDVVAVAGGRDYSVALKTDGTVWAWGNDGYGQLGDGTVGSPEGSATPSQVVAPGGGFLADVIAIAAGYSHSVALKADGTVWAWGDDAYGQLGDGTVGDPNATPGQVVTLTNVIAIAGGFHHSVALKGDGTVWAWGNDSSGQLGDGTQLSPENNATPSQVVAPGGGILADVIAIAGGTYHNLALKADGSVWAWGSDDSGQLGDGSIGGPSSRATPIQVIASGGGFLASISAVAAAGQHSLALKSDGTVWAWGYDVFGQLGDGTVGSPDGRATPGQVVSLTGVSAIAAGNYHGLALKSDGTVWAWGYDGEGALGDGTVGSPMNSAVPNQVVAPGGGFLTEVTAIAGGFSHILALKALPQPLLTVAPVTVAAGSTVTLTATLTDDGAGLSGQTIAFSLRGTPVGTATTNASGVATLSVSLGSIPVGNYPTGIGAGFAGNANYRASSGTAELTVTMPPGPVWSWGFDSSGQLGDGTAGTPSTRATPGQVVGPTSGTFLTDVVAIASGDSHGLALKSDGTVWAWGDDAYGQLGDGTVASSNASATPSQVVAPGGGVLTDVVAIAAGGFHSLALKADGTVWAWGWDGLGQLGDGTVASPDTRATPTQVVAPGGGFLTDVTAIAGGLAHSLALKADGTVWAWGQDAKGELGDGTMQSPISSGIPSQVVAPGGGFLTTVIAIAAGGNHSLALRDDGTVWAWGDDGNGQLGDGTVGSPTTRATPGQVVSLTGVSAVAAGGNHSLALKGDGTVWAWGDDGFGQLGDGTVGSPATRATPGQVVSLTGISAIAGGTYHNLALKADGTVWAWGNDGAGQLGDGTAASPDTRATPGQVVSLTGVSAVAAGGNHSLALTLPVPLLTVNPVTTTAGSTVTLTATLTDGGAGLSGQTIAFSLRGTPVGSATTNASGVATLNASLGSIPVGNYPTGVGAAFAGSAAYRASSGTANLRVTPVPSTVWAWGYDASGQLGDGTVGSPDSRATPGQVVAPGGVLTDVIAIAGGISHGLALKSDGTVWAWGDDTYGQLGDGTVASPATRATPSQVVSLTDVIAIGGRGFHSLALKGDGTVWTWGNDGSGQLGDGTVASPATRATPSQVVSLTGVVAIVGGTSYSLALKSDGTVWAWGDDAYGQLGDGTIGSPTTRATPSQVAAPGGGFLTDVVAIAGGAFHCLALKGDGTVWAWGNDGSGQLGDGTVGPDNRATPGQVVSLTSVVAITDGGLHSLALKSDGTVWAWGDDTYGQLGDGTVGSPTTRATPGQVVSLTSVVAIAGGGSHSLALRSDGAVWTWGRNNAGQLGNGSVGAPSTSATPSQVVAPGGGFLTNVTAVSSRNDYNLALQSSAARQLTTGSTGSGSGTVSPPSGTFQDGTAVSVSAVPAAGSLFTGWTVDGAPAGWANPLSLTMDQNHTVQATFAAAKTFAADVPSNHPNYTAITELASRGYILGYNASSYGPNDGVQRAQMAVLIARATPFGPGTPTNGYVTPPDCTVAGTWDCEDWGNTFTDRGGIDIKLWRAAGTLQHYQVARGYAAADCAAQGRAFPCYGPTDPVSHAQTIAFITRAMVAKGYWALQPNAPLPDPGVPAVLAPEARTFAFYTGGLPSLPNGKGWNDSATRGWFAEALWAALNSYWGTDGNLPDGRPGGGAMP